MLTGLSLIAGGQGVRVTETWLRDWSWVVESGWGGVWWQADVGAYWLEVLMGKTAALESIWCISLCLHGSVEMLMWSKSQKMSGNHPKLINSVYVTERMEIYKCVHLGCIIIWLRSPFFSAALRKIRVIDRFTQCETDARMPGGRQRRKKM